MSWSKERFASDSVCPPQSRPKSRPKSSPKSRPEAEPEVKTAEPLPPALAQQRLVDPRLRGIGPVSLVTTLDQALQTDLGLGALVLWDSEALIRFDLCGTRILLILPEAEMPNPTGLTLAVQDMGNQAEALLRQLIRRLTDRFPALEPAPLLPLDPDVAALLHEPLAQAPTALPPVDSLEDEVWHGDAARAQPVVTPAPEAAPPSAWQRLRARLTRPQLPVLHPMRPAIRLLALGLFALGLMQGPMNQGAEAGTQNNGTNEDGTQTQGP